MEKLIPYSICTFLLIMGIKGSVESAIYEGNIKYSLNRMLYYFSIFIAFILISINLDKIFIWIIDLSTQWFNFNVRERDIFRILVLIIIYFFVQTITYFIMKIIFNSILSNKENQNKYKLVFLSTIFGALKGFVAVLILFIGIRTYNITIGANLQLKLFDEINIYSKISDIVTSTKPTVEYISTEKFIPANNILIYYNGVTLEEGIRSNDAIDAKAIELTMFGDSEREKAKTLYTWIGSNIIYDYDKATKALNNENTGDSGAIDAWNERSGICFDYSCLYVAMARAVNLKVRLITGSGFDGKQYGPHAWNEVFLEDENIWIPVDTTFYLAGNYFDSDNFYSDHIRDGIAGEW